MTAKSMKLTINLIFLSISIFLSTYFMAQLSDNPYIRAGIILFAVGLEAAMQYVLALGKAHYKCPVITKKLTALILFICYAAYILVYNIPSAVGFFVMEIDVQEQAATKAEMVETVNRQRLVQIARTIDNLNQQLETESATGYGGRSKAIMEQLEKLRGEQERLQAEFSGQSMDKISKNVFRSLEGVLKVPANILKIVIFGTSIFMLCLILIITSWDIRIGDDVIKAVTPVTVTAVTKPVVKERNTVTKRTCPVCGDPAKPGGVYCSDKCRVAAFRERKKLEEAGVSM